MTYAGYTEYRLNQVQKVPFKAYTDFMSTISEAVCFALESIVRFVVRGVEDFRAKRTERATRGALSDLNDRTLKDIGIHRSQINSVSRHAAQDPNFDHRVNYQ